MPRINPSALPAHTNAIEKYVLEDLTQFGLDEVDAQGVEKLKTFVLDNDIDGYTTTPQPGGGRSEKETVDLKGLLRKDPIRAFFTGEGRRALETYLDMRGTIYGGLHGKEVAMPKGTLTRYDLSRIDLRRLPIAFRREVESRSEIFQNPLVSAEEKGVKLYLLFADYAEAMHRRGASEKQRSELLDQLDSIPASTALLLTQDSDGDGFSNAYELAHGTDPGKPENKFALRAEGWSTYQNMHGSFYDIAEKLDAVCKAMGRPAGISEYEHRSAVAWLMGEKGGNTISGYLEEKRAISSTSGVDFVKGLFPATDRAWNARLEADFDIAVDFLDAAGRFVSFDRAAGDRMMAVHSATGEPLRAQSEDVRVEGEDAPRYRPVFQKQDGTVVPAGEVTLVIADARGRVKGDGKAEASHSAGWWGFCDRNALNRLVTTRFGYPAPDQDVTLEVGGQKITFDARQILDIVGRRMTELFSKYEYTGQRYDNELSQIRLKDGTTLLGRLSTEVNLDRAGVDRDGDFVTLTAQGDEDLLGRMVMRVVRRQAPGYPELQAVGPRGETFEVLADQIPGGFRATASKPVAWKLSAADLKKLADLVLPVADARKVGRSNSIPTAESTKEYMTGLLDAFAAGQRVELWRAAGPSSWMLSSLARDWAASVVGAEDRAIEQLPLLTKLKEIYAANPEGEARQAAVTAATANDPVAQAAVGWAQGLSSELWAQLGVDSSAYWSLSYDARTAKVLEWFDAADAAKVALVKATRSTRDFGSSLEVLFTSVPRAEVLSKIEAFRLEQEAAAEADHVKYMEKFRADLGRISELSVQDRQSWGRDGSRMVKSYELLVPKVEGDDNSWRMTLSVSEDSLSFDRLYSYSSSDDQELSTLRGKIFDLLTEAGGRAEVARTEDEMTFPEATVLPQDIEIAVADGSKRTVRSTDIAELRHEDAADVVLEALIAHVKRHGGVTNADSWMNEGVSNGLHVFTSIRDYQANDPDAPGWIADVASQPMFGKNGEVKNKSRVRYYDLGNETDDYWSSGTRGWIEFDDKSRPINSSIIQGNFDFLWSIQGEPDWFAYPTFNPNVPADVVLSLYVSSVKDQEKLQALADKKLLPEDWRSYLRQEPTLM